MGFIVNKKSHFQCKEILFLLKLTVLTKPQSISPVTQSSIHVDFSL